MDVQEAQKLDQGAKFFRGDLHIHSVAGSHDVKDTLATPEAIVKTAHGEGLHLIAITDHNDITGIEAAIDAAKSLPIMVVPAIELSTAHGHLLCYLPTLEALRKFYAKLSIVESGTPNSRCSTGVVDTLNLVREHGGFAILAHVDGGKGLETELPGSPPHKKDIICHAALLGIELTSSSCPVHYSDQDTDAGRKQLGRDRIDILGLGKSQFLARVLNSDAHSLKALGRNAAGDRKVTRFKMQDVSFDALRLALEDADARVRIEEEIPARMPVVRAITLEGGFLTGQAINFSPNLNCIIGGRGTGKSTTFEAIRCLTGHGGGSDVIDSEVWPEMVRLVVEDQAGQLHQMSRRLNADVENVLDPDAPPAAFPVECYAQSEAATISQSATSDPASLLKFLDRFMNIAADAREENELRQSLLESETELKKAEDLVARIPSVLRDLTYKRSQLSALEKQNGKEVIALIRKLEGEKQLRISLRNDAKNLLESTTHDTLKEYVANIENCADPAGLTVGRAECEAITREAAIFKKKVVQSETDLTAAAQALSKTIDSNLQAWRTKEGGTQKEIDTKKAALEASGVRLDMVFINGLSSDEAALAERLRKLKTWEPALENRRKERAALVKKRWEVRSRIAMKRSAYAAKATKTLQSVLTDLNVSLKFKESALSPSAHAVIAEAMSWKTSQVPRAPLLAETLTVPKLLEAVAKRDRVTIKAVKSADGATVFSDADAAIIIEKLSDPEVCRKLEAVEVLDKPSLVVSKPVAGQQRPLIRDFSRLSLGQKQSVLLALMLSAESNKPLIIDQPEDHLDSEFIYQTLVPVLRRAKERRQVIVVTHNANIAVLGDAEQIIVLKAQDEKGMVISRGSIDHPETRKNACAILEGSAEAFKRRAKVYGVAS